MNYDYEIERLYHPENFMADGDCENPHEYRPGEEEDL